MQKHIHSLLLVGLVLLHLPIFAVAQDTSVKDLYLAHANNPTNGKAGVKIRLELRRDGKTRMVPQGFKFRSGDQVKFHFETNFAAYVKITNLASSGVEQQLFPYTGVNSMVPKAKKYTVPRGDLWFEFNDTPGIEHLTFIFSARPFSSTVSLAPSTTDQGTVSVNRPRPVPSYTNGNTEQALNDLNSRAFQIPKDLVLVSDRVNDEACAFVVVNGDAARNLHRMRIDLIHQ